MSDGTGEQGRKSATRSWRRSGLVDLLAAVAITFMVLGPLLVRRGFALRGDMVFVPDLPWKDSWLGLDGAAARFAPGDAVIWLGNQMLPGDILQKVVLAGAFMVGILGLARLTRERSALARVAAAILFVWNPWVFERLSIGQWPVVVGYLLLPWLVTASQDLAGAGPSVSGASVRRWSRYVVVAGGISVCSPAAAMVGVATSVVVLICARASWRTGAGATVVLVMANLPWVVPSFAAASPIRATDGQFRAFAAAAESPLGDWLSLVSLGGIWKSSVVPPERTLPLIIAVSATISVIGLVGVWLARGPERVVADSLLVLGGGALLLAGLPTIGAIADLLDDAALSAPFVGVLRDSHRFLGPLALAVAFGLAHAVDGLRRLSQPGREGVNAAAVVLAFLPVLCLPSMAWGMGGDLRPVAYPAEWDEVAHLLEDGGEGDAVVLPWHGTYRGFAWNGLRAVLDPAPRYFPGTVLIDDRHFLDGIILESESRRLATIGAAVQRTDSAAALRGLGVRWVVVHKENGVSVVPDGTVVHDGATLQVVDLGPPPVDATERPRGRVAVMAVVAVSASGWIVAIAMLLAVNMYGVAHKREV